MTVAESERARLERFVHEYPERPDLLLRLLKATIQERQHITSEQLNRAFPEYPGQSEIFVFLADNYQICLDTGDFDFLEMPTKFLVEKFPECPICLHFRSQLLFHSGRDADALRLLKLNLDVVEKESFLVKSYSQMLWNALRHDEARKFIVQHFNTHDTELWRSVDFAIGQHDAIARGIPPILIATLPKSGSLFILNTLVRGLSLPSTYLCPVGLYIDIVLESHVRDFAKGGAICVDHILANQNNLDSLHRNGIRKIVFHHRDLRQATISLMHQSASDEIEMMPKSFIMERRKSLSDNFESEYIIYFKEYLQFLETWAKALETEERFEFMVTDFDDLEDEQGLIGKILDFYEIPREKFDWSILDTDHKERAGHFRKGLKDEWREVLSPELQAEINSLLDTSSIVSRLNRSKG